MSRFIAVSLLMQHTTLRQSSPLSLLLLFTVAVSGEFALTLLCVSRYGLGLEISPVSQFLIRSIGPFILLIIPLRVALFGWLLRLRVMWLVNVLLAIAIAALLWDAIVAFQLI